MKFDNLLNKALSILPKYQATWFKFDGLTVDDRGREKASYIDNGVIKGSLQPVSLNTVIELGLDNSKEYINFYTSHDLSNTKRDGSPDYLEIDGVRYDVLDVTDWIKIDGWKGVLCIKQI